MGRTGGLQVSRLKSTMRGYYQSKGDLGEPSIRRESLAIPACFLVEFLILGMTALWPRPSPPRLSSSSPNLQDPACTCLELVDAVA